MYTIPHIYIYQRYHSTIDDSTASTAIRSKYKDGIVCTKDRYNKDTVDNSQDTEENSQDRYKPVYNKNNQDSYYEDKVIKDEKISSLRKAP